ncbi:hypothetical protein FRACA_40003 [Frankia canadensis]|uniref:Uncharacterized protein n=1 Tax=Frankia canadensis TaxID=1836972 RepID=A0A2I2KWD9_9ACTN|nr:hypothetical protein FRACA_40003 [Frankia canadensis]SOU57265.1 hypothetical protein FRACA_40003 [Frankia canadensis]
MPTAHRSQRTSPPRPAGRTSQYHTVHRQVELRLPNHRIQSMVTGRPWNYCFTRNSGRRRPSMSATRRAPRTNAAPRLARSSARPCT